jgi:FixJ family two-component response regulator
MRDSTMSQANQTHRTASTVLVVDDDSSVLNALARLIHSAGYDVRRFSRPSALLADNLPTDHACMVVDVYLPEMNGVELCEELARRGRGLPAILISGRDDAATRNLVQRTPALAVLFKPIDEGDLLPAIARALGSGA